MLSKDFDGWVCDHCQRPFMLDDVDSGERPSWHLRGTLAQFNTPGEIKERKRGAGVDYCSDECIVAALWTLKNHNNGDSALNWVPLRINDGARRAYFTTLDERLNND